MGYDGANRLAAYAEKKDDLVVLTQENQYNGTDQRIQKKETKGQDAKTSNYYYQGTSPLYTTDEKGDRTSLNLMGLSDNVIATSRGTGSSEAWYLYNKDVRESTSSLIDSSGEVAVAYAYDAFGNTDVRIGQEFDNEVAYTGQIWDRNTGLYYYNARYYNPEDGRFVSQDTYRGEQKEPGTWHLYAYCANNPVNYVDPSGHFAIVIPGIAAGIVAAAIFSGSVIIVAGIAWIAGSQLAKVKKKKKKTYYYQAMIPRNGYVYFRKGLTKKQAVARLRSKKNVLATTAERAKSACRAASPLKLAQYEDAHKKKCGYRKHYHPVKKNRDKNKYGKYKNRIDAHCFY